MNVPPELPVTPIPPQTEIETVPRPLNATLFEQARVRAEKTEAKDRVEISAEARVFDDTRRLVRDALSADQVEPEEVADRAFETVRTGIYPAYRAERGGAPEAIDTFATQVRRGVERGVEESRARPRPEGAAFEPLRDRAVARLQQSLVSFVDAEQQLARTNRPPTSS